MLSNSSNSNINSDIELYERYLGIDLLTRGGNKLLSNAEYKSLKLAIAKYDRDSLLSITSLYELRPKGLDTKENISLLLSYLGLVLEGNRDTNYKVSSLILHNLIQYPSLLGEYRHLSNIGDAIRSLESKPGNLGYEFLSLYSWGKRIKNTNTTKTTNTLNTINKVVINDVSSNSSISRPPSKNILGGSKLVSRAKEREIVLM